MELVGEERRGEAKMVELQRKARRRGKKGAGDWPDCCREGQGARGGGAATISSIRAAAKWLAIVNSKR